jgi:hypothetical protein
MHIPILAFPLDVFGRQDALPALSDDIIDRQAEIPFYAFFP